MTPGATAERVFEALRRQILDAAFRPGDRLDPGVIAGHLATSVTPVRDALNRLTGEGLVEPRLTGGFHLPALDEPMLQDLYRWSEQLLRITVASGLAGTAIKAPPDPPRLDGDEAPAEAVGRFFGAIGALSDNAEHGLAIGRLNARLHVARNAEALVLPDTAGEFDEWVEAIAKPDRRRLQQAIGRYHRRRQRLAGAIVRAVYRRAP